MTFDIVAKGHDELATAPFCLPEKQCATRGNHSGNSKRATPSRTSPDGELGGHEETYKLGSSRDREMLSKELRPEVTSCQNQASKNQQFIDRYDEESDQNSYETKDQFTPSTSHYYATCNSRDKQSTVRTPLGTSKMNRGWVLEQKFQDSARKKRKLSSSPVEESQDSLTGTIHVASQPRHTPARPARRSRTKIQPSPVDQASSGSRAAPIEPNSSTRGTRSAVREGLTQLRVKVEEIRVLFASSTSVGDSKAFTKFLTSQGVKKVQAVPDCTMLCVGKGGLKKTGKFILAVMLGKEVITDDWVIDSAKKGKLQEIGQYIARDEEREQEWGVDLEQAIKRGKQGLRVLQDWTVVFTPSAKKEVGKSGLSELHEIVTFAGAKSVSGSIPKKGPEDMPLTLVIGTQEDINTPALQTWKVYARDILSLSVLRGNLDIDSEEFLVDKVRQQKEKDSKRKHRTMK